MDEHQEKLKQYILQQLKSGIPAPDITAQLQGAGWPEADIQTAFQTAQAELFPAAPISPPSSIQSTAETTQPPGSQQPQVAQTIPRAAGTKRGRIRVGWQLFKQSFRLLNGNRYLLRFMLMIGVWAFVITFAFIAIYLWLLVPLVWSGNSGAANAVVYGFAFLDYLLIYFFINLYAAGMTANILDIFEGKRQPYAEYMRLARAKGLPIFVFSFFSATIGMFLQFVVERIRYVGWIISWLLGTLWSLGTLFVIPIIMTSEEPSAPRSIKQSVRFFKQTWGENVTAKIGVNLPLFLLNILVLAIFIVLGFILGPILSVWIIVPLFILYFIIQLAIAVVGSFANTLINVALFYYATYHRVPPAFDAELLNRVFIKRKRRFFKKSNT